jgi:hypothetical protein
MTVSPGTLFHKHLPAAPGRSIMQALAIIARLPVVVAVSNWLRVEE